MSDVTDDSTTGLERGSTRVEGNDAHDTRDGLVIYTQSDDAVHQLNAMSTVIYELSDGRELGAIARSLEAIFELSPEDADELALRGFEELRQAGLVT